MLVLDFKKIFPLFSLGWDWIQVEVTSDCNAACIYCPRTLYKESWPNQHLPLAIFKKLKPAFAHTRLVHLQGWGEPFLNPDFFEMVAIAKAAGCQVGTTTNGMLLNEERIKRLIESGVDVVAFSLAGTGEENDAIRKGTRLAKVLDAIRSMSREKERQVTTKPAIHIAYMLFRSGIEHLGELPRLLRGSGVSDVVISFLDFVPSDELQREVIAPAEYEEVRSRLEALKAEAAALGLKIHHLLESPGQMREECTENVQQALCIASDGSVTPCVYTNLQVRQASHVLRGEKRSYERMVFGNINEKPLKAIWRTKAYTAFRKSFCKNQLALPCQNCPRLRRI